MTTTRSRLPLGTGIHWNVLLIPLATLAIIAAGFYISAKGSPVPEPAPTPIPTPTSSSTATSEATTSLATEPWSYNTKVAPIPADKAVEALTTFARALYTGRYQDDALVDWWNVDGKLANVATNQIRYLLIEYPEMQTAGLTPGADLTTIDTQQTGTATPGQWNGTVTLTFTDDHTITAHVSVIATEKGWKVDQWEVTP